MKSRLRKHAQTVVGAFWLNETQLLAFACVVRKSSAVINLSRYNIAR